MRRRAFELGRKAWFRNKGKTLLRVRAEKLGISNEFKEKGRDKNDKENQRSGCACGDAHYEQENKDHQRKERDVP
jgi:hypothetical protein